MTAYEVRISDGSSDVCSSDLPDREGARRAEAGAGRDVANRHQLDRRADIVARQRLADDRMADLPGLLDPLELGILDEIVGPEGAVQRDVDVAVYRDRKSTRLNSSH